MSDLANTLPCCRRELVFSTAGDAGRYVVKDPRAGEYFSVGEEEYFLLTQLNGVQSPGTVCATFAERFGEPLAPNELAEFLELARSRGFFEQSPANESRAAQRPAIAAPTRPDKASFIGARVYLIPTGSSPGWNRESASSGRGLSLPVG